MKAAQKAQGAATLTQADRDGLEAQRESCRIAFENRDIDDPEARIAAVAGL